MRYLMICIVVLALCSPGNAAEVTFGLDRCVVLNSPSDAGAETKLALHFALPEELDSAEVIYAELFFTLPPMRLREDSLFEIRLYPLLAEWQEDGIDYDESEAITDSMDACVYTIRLGDINDIKLDVTSFLQQVIGVERQNFGLMALFDLLGDANIRLPESLYLPIREQARIKVVYK